MGNAIKQAIAVGKDVSNAFRELQKKIKKKIVDQNAKISRNIQQSNAKEVSGSYGRLRGKNGAKL